MDEGIPLEPPAPRLQPQPGESTGLVDRGISPDWETAPEEEMRRFLAEEEQELTSYGWVDAGNGIARVPIDRAMELIIEQGLPETPLQPVDEAGGAERAWTDDTVASQRVQWIGRHRGRPLRTPSGSSLSRSVQLFLVSGGCFFSADDLSRARWQEVGFDQRLGESVPLDAVFYRRAGRAMSPWVTTLATDR